MQAIIEKKLPINKDMRIGSFFTSFLLSSECAENGRSRRIHKKPPFKLFIDYYLVFSLHYWHSACQTDIDKLKIQQ